MKAVVDNASIKLRNAATKYGHMKEELAKANDTIKALTDKNDSLKAKKFSCVIM